MSRGALAMGAGGLGSGLLRGWTHEAARNHSYDFTEFDELVRAAAAVSTRAEVVVLLGSEAGLRAGEMRALEWPDISFVKQQVRVARNDWRGQVTTTKGQPGTCRAPNTCCGSAAARGSTGQPAVLGRARPAAHVPFAPGDARCADAGDSGTGGASRPLDDAALHAPESERAHRRDSAARTALHAAGAWRHSGDGAGLIGKLLQWQGIVVSPEGIDNGKARPQAEAVLLMSSGIDRSEWERGMVSPICASWNRLDAWLRQVDGLRQAA